MGGSSGTVPKDWLTDLLQGEAGLHDLFVEVVEVSDDGTLDLKSAVEMKMASSALGSLLNRAARSPFAGEGRVNLLVPSIVGNSSGDLD